MRMRGFFWLFGLGLAIAACGDGDGGGIPDTNLAGMIDGQAFSFVSGRSEVDTEQDCIDIDLFDQAGGCSVHMGSGLMVFFTTPSAEPGSYSLGMSHTVTLYNPDGNMNTICTLGRVELESGDGVIEGGLTASYDDENHVAGRFTIDICQ
ncbi:MAG: hypothetical protein JXR96_19195 [Deltaproteobacteria bacterium]|nr:hypothetical protein [Deltaproteobacteria bacterium]